jgi:hypothetical protein
MLYGDKSRARGLAFLVGMTLAYSTIEENGNEQHIL